MATAVDPDEFARHAPRITNLPPVMSMAMNPPAAADAAVANVSATADAPPPLDERSRRRPGFTGGSPVRLGDGAEWYLPVPPRDRTYFVRDPAGRTVAIHGSTLGDEYNALLERVMLAETVNDESVALADLAFDLLARNYDLTFGDMRGLLFVLPAAHPEKATNQAMWTRLVEIAAGFAAPVTGPEPSPATGP